MRTCQAISDLTRNDRTHVCAAIIGHVDLDLGAQAVCKTTGLAGSHAVGQWIVTLKMLVVAPENVFGEALDFGRDGPNDFHLAGDMHLRNPEWLVMDRDMKLSLKIRYFHDPKLPRYEDAIMASPRLLLRSTPSPIR